MMTPDVKQQPASDGLMKNAVGNVTGFFRDGMSSVKNAAPMAEALYGDAFDAGWATRVKGV